MLAPPESPEGLPPAPPPEELLSAERLRLACIDVFLAPVTPAEEVVSGGAAPEAAAVDGEETEVGALPVRLRPPFILALPLAAAAAAVMRSGEPVLAYMLWLWKVLP